MIAGEGVVNFSRGRIWNNNNALLLAARKQSCLILTPSLIYKSALGVKFSVVVVILKPMESQARLSLERQTIAFV